MTKKQSNISKASTHLKEDCQVLLFRFKNEFGKEKSLVDPKGRSLIPEFCPKDFTPRCTPPAGSILYQNTSPFYFMSPTFRPGRTGFGHWVLTKKFPLTFAHS